MAVLFEVFQRQAVLAFHASGQDGPTLVYLRMCVSDGKEEQLDFLEYALLNKQSKELQHDLVLVLTHAVVCLKKQNRREASLPFLNLEGTWL